MSFTKYYKAFRPTTTDLVGQPETGQKRVYPGDTLGPHAAHSTGAKTNSSFPYSGNLWTVQPRLFAAGSA